MKLRHATRRELDREARGDAASWSSAACRRLLELIDHQTHRVLVAEEEGQVRAVLGISMDRADGESARTATIVELVVDPCHAQGGLGSLLLRFAENVALVDGCCRIKVDSRITGRGDAHCRPSPGRASPAEDQVFKLLRPLPAEC